MDEVFDVTDVTDVTGGLGGLCLDGRVRYADHLRATICALHRVYLSVLVSLDERRTGGRMGARRIARSVRQGGAARHVERSALVNRIVHTSQVLASRFVFRFGSRFALRGSGVRGSRFPVRRSVSGARTPNPEP